MHEIRATINQPHHVGEDHSGRRKERREEDKSKEGGGKAEGGGEGAETKRGEGATRIG